MTTVEKSLLTQQFSRRLRDALIAKGYCSARSPSGVDVHQFAQMTGYSLQICRKYLRGQAVPESSKLAEIALQLGVSPGWLLFGDCHSVHAKETNKITINKDLLQYIFSHISALYQPASAQTDLVTQFFLEVTHNVSQISDDPEQSKKIIDLALFSAKKFSDNE